jgi:hypothetical protein
MDRKEARLLRSTMFWLLCLPLFCSGQENLISNWSFEELRPNTNGDTICPNSLGQIYLSKDWKSANSSIDYFNACSNADWPSFGVPSNLYGDQQAYSDSAYAHFACYTILFDDAREYVTQELEEPLQQGQGYRFSMQLSLTDSCNYAVAGIGALFSAQDTRFWNDDDFFEVEPQVENDIDSLIDDKHRWVEVGGQFVANGGEKFLTIGCFNRDVDENIQQVSNIPEASYNWDFSSYYLDGVVLQKDNSIGVEELFRISVYVYPNPSETGLFTVQVAENVGICGLEVYSVDGRIVLKDSFLSGQVHKLDAQHLNQGVYFAYISDDAQRLIWNGKLVL